MKVSQFNRVFYKGNINIHFYFYCLKNDIRLIKFLFYNIWYLILSYIFVSKKDLFIRKQYCYLQKVNDLDNVLIKFCKKNKINNYFNIESDVILDKVPVIFIKNYFKNIKIIGYEFDENYEVKLEKFNSEIGKIKNIEYFYLNNRYLYPSIKSKFSFVICNRFCKYLPRRSKNINKIIQILSLFILSIIITCFSFLFTNSYLNINMFKSYFEFKLFILNWVPIIIVMLFIFLVIKRVHISWLITSIIVFIWGVANQTKVFYRDDIIKFEDLKLIKEAMIMTGECDVVIKSYTIFFAIVIIFVYFICRKKIEKLEMKKSKRFVSIILLLCLSILGYKNIYKNNNIYDSVGDVSLVNRWITTRQSQIRGLVYPFIYGLEDGILKAPDNYDEKKVKETLKKYEYSNIPDDKKVNIIAIMLEAYNDFSKFKEINFKEDIYKYLHEIQEISISGNLITNIFGGGTINTERSFLTGYQTSSNFRKKTDSYVWYFKEQGYRTESMHPIYGAFYNRTSVNSNLGFDVYYNYENKYSKIQYEFVNDDLFFKSIVDGYEKSKKDKVPYFNFSVTYQNHVPYSTNYYDGKEYYFDNTIGLDNESYNLINQYFSGIKKTNEALSWLIDYFEKEQEPVIVVFFGDHNPALGDNASIYHDLGINISLDNIEGYLNYYETPYVIYANDAAKQSLSNDFVGDGNIISPIFLMNELFENMGLIGNEYLQYMSNLKNKVDVISTLYYKEDGNFVDVNNSKYEKLLNEYEWINYYKLDN